MFEVLLKPALWLILLAGSVFPAGAQTIREQVPPQTKIGNLVIAQIQADDPSQEIAKLVDVLKKERAKDPTKLVVLVEGIEVDVAPEPRVDDELSVHPNPLRLTITVDAKGNLDLNTEKRGSLADLSSITKRLAEIFKAREDNGVFRENTNDIEKTVSVGLHAMLKVRDLGKIVTTLDAAGSDRIVLLIDPPLEIEEITPPQLPQVPGKPKKRKKP